MSSGRTFVSKFSAGIVGISYVLTVLFMVGLTYSQFHDRHQLATGTKVTGTIIDASNGKSNAMGTVVYRLPSGAECRDWIELGPNSTVHSGEPLDVAVEDSCGHPVSTKKRLSPWNYAILGLSGLLYPFFFLWRSRRKRQQPVTAE